jgi:ribosomal protein L12E/L44/L45/RPP1/RPP2
MLLLLLCCRGPDLGLGPEKVRREIQLQARLSHVNIVELKQVRATNVRTAAVAAAAAPAAAAHSTQPVQHSGAEAGESM